MNYHAEHTFNAPHEAVWAMFTNPDAHTAKFASMGHRDIEVLECDHDADTFRIKIQRLVDFDVPRFARRIFTPTNTVTSTETWTDNGDGTYRANWTGETVGVPIDVTGQAALEPSDGGTNYRLDVEVEIRVPIIGGKVADFARGDARRQVDQEFAAGDSWLAAHAGSQTNSP